MQSSLAESVQQQVRPGKCVDLYYPDPQTAEKACYRTIVNTRFQQGMNSLSSGTNTFVVPPNNGVQDIICVFEIGDLTAITANGLGLNRGWGYNLIKSVSWRYGGSSQFFLNKQQILQLALRKCPNGFSRDDLLALGGAALNATGLANGPNFAYCFLPLPHSMPTSDGKLPPIPSDLLTQQIIVQVELEQVSSIFSTANGFTGTIPTTLASGAFVAQQVLFENQGDALARRVDMSTHALSFPIEFTQQEVQIPLLNQAGGSQQTISLTGFRAGECRSIHLWLTADTDVNGVTTGTGTIKNPFAWYAPESVVLTYAGEIYSNFTKGSGALWNLINGRLAPQVDDIYLADNGAGAGAGVVVITNGIVDQWVECPFAQPYNSDTAHSMYTAGKNITNGIVQVAFTIPQYSKSGAALGAQNWTLHASYNYNAVLMFTGGTADYVL
jgi:hypothetical protein